MNTSIVERVRQQLWLSSTLRRLLVYRSDQLCVLAIASQTREKLYFFYTDAEPYGRLRMVAAGVFKDAIVK